MGLIVAALGLAALVGAAPDTFGLRGGSDGGPALFGERPDSVGSAIVYARARGLLGQWGATIWRAKANGSDPVHVGTGQAPAISPDGRWIAYVRSSMLHERTAKSRIYVVAAKGGPAHLVWRSYPDEFYDVVWSPDSRRLAVLDGGDVDFGTYGGLVLLDLQRGTHTWIARSTRDEGAAEPSFSPDGRSIVYTLFERTRSHLVVYDMARARTIPLRAGVGSGAVWGPRWIAYQHGADIWLIGPDGSDAHELTRVKYAIDPEAWSRDGAHLLAANPAMHNGRLWAIDVPSGRMLALTDWEGDLFPQDLSRDGKTVLAAIGCGGSISRDGYIETIPFAGGRPHVIVRGPCRASWNR